jgi:hypothetical protein
MYKSENLVQDPKELAMDTFQFLQLILQQTDAFTSMGNLELTLQKVLLDKRFIDSEYLLHQMQQLSDQIIELEAQRELEFQDLLQKAGLSPESTFQDLLGYLNSTDRELLASGYRDLKMSVFRVRAVAQGIDTYTRHHVNVLRGVVDELYPDRKQRTYTAVGMAKETVTPMILDHTL